MIVILSLSLLAFTGALPSGIGQGTLETIAAEISLRKSNDNVDARNVVDVPANCPPGQVLVNGVCRDIWKSPAKVAPIVKLTCLAGYAAVGGECIDWSRNVITVPNNCPEGQVWVNGACREVWRNSKKIAPTVTLICPAGYTAVGGECIDWSRNVITVPNNCPEGQAWVNGACRDIWKSSRKIAEEPANEAGSRNTIVTPDNCKPNQQWVNGQCREIWRSGSPMIRNE